MKEGTGYDISLHSLWLGNNHKVGFLRIIRLMCRLPFYLSLTIELLMMGFGIALLPWQRPFLRAGSRNKHEIPPSGNSERNTLNMSKLEVLK